MVLGSLPIIVAFVLRIMNPEYFGVLVTPTGKLIVAFAIVIWLVGVTWLVSLTKVDI